jgi:hypothetical protein
MSIATVGAHGMARVATSFHNSDRSFDISDILLLAPKIATSLLTSETHCYCDDTSTVATSPHNSDKSSDINGLLLLDHTTTSCYTIQMFI